MKDVGALCELMALCEERGIVVHAGDEVGLMRAKKFYRSIGWRENRDFYIYGGEIFLNINWPLRPGQRT